MHSAKAHHVHLFAKVLEGLFVEAGTLLSQGVGEGSAVNNVVKLLAKNVGKKNQQMTGTVTTDGVTANVHFRKRKSDQELHEIEEGKKRRKAMADAKKGDDDGDETLKQKQKQKTVSEQQASSLASRVGGCPEWMVVTDPGRINIATSVIFHDGHLVRDAEGKPLSFKLTAGRYYTESGVDKRTREQNAIRKAFGLREVDAIASMGATTGADAEKVRVHGAVIRRFRDSVWSYAMRRKTRNVALRNAAGRERVLTNHWTCVRRECGAPSGMDVEHVVGCAKVGACGIGNRPVPTGRAFVVAKRTFPNWSPACEYRTSQVCDVCHGDIGCVRMCRENHVDAMRNGTYGKQDVKLDFFGSWSCIAEAEDEDNKNRVYFKPLWYPLGHDRMSASELKEMRLDEERRCGAVYTRYVRGLLTCETGCKKYRDRDVTAAINIGSIYVRDVQGLKRDPAFDRTVSHVPKKKSRRLSEFQRFPGLTTENALEGSEKST